MAVIACDLQSGSVLLGVIIKSSTKMADASNRSAATSSFAYIRGGACLAQRVRPREQPPILHSASHSATHFPAVESLKESGGIPPPARYASSVKDHQKVALDALSPGEFKRKGAGLEIRWGIANTPFGCCAIAWSPRGISRLAFLEQDPGKDMPRAWIDDWREASWVRDDPGAQSHAHSIFVPSSTQTCIRAFVRGTSFQLKVWRALLQIPSGNLATYGHIARAIGIPQAARAVGTACGQNPVAVLIPCHRVIRQTGILDGYRWGTARKRALIAWESLSPPARAVLPPTVG
jgi:O-6-methylguanine DNA methyltransferase